MSNFFYFFNFLIKMSYNSGMEKAKIMFMAVQQALKTSGEGIGGPFGAAVVKDGEIVSLTSNTVLADHDPTAHAEVNAIREAGRILGTHDLSDCELYATGYPCPMCLSAIIWANIRSVYFGCTPKDAEAIGFRDDFIYNYIVSLRQNREDKTLLNLTQLNREDCIRLFEEYSKNSREIY